MAIVPVQVRLDEKTHARVAELAERLNISRNAAYTALITLGLDRMALPERLAAVELAV
jgi:predicted transcriptional regulator